MAGEIGIEWVNDYHSWWWPDLVNCQANARGFYNRLNGIQSFDWGDDWAWDEDLEESGAGTPSAGMDHWYADDVDIEPQVTGRDSGQAKHSEVRLGERDLEWLVIDACYVVREGAKYYNNCQNMFRGLHYIFGFHTVTYDNADRGEIFADYLNSGETVRNAWIKACQDTEGSSVEWAYLRAASSGVTTYTENWHGAGTVSADPNPGTQTIYYLRGSC